jgi:hypothetical protein
MKTPRQMRSDKRRQAAIQVLKMVETGMTVDKACSELRTSRGRIYREFAKMRSESLFDDQLLK